jgi:SPX domain protein involved in polyphosphate accumulation
LVINTFCRREKKLLVDNELVPILKQAFLQHMHPDKHNKDGLPYVISNLYFDNDSDDSIRHSISKPPYKEKLRLRVYGWNPTKDSEAFIEIKKKLNRVGTKRRAILTLGQAEEYIATGKHPDGLSYLDEQVLREIDYYLSVTHAVPKVYISYQRNAYHGIEDHSLRATIDTDILTRRENLSLDHERYGTPLLPPGKTLLEIKFSGALPLWFANLMSEHHLSFGSFSKYGTEYRHYLWDTNDISYI